MSTPLSSSEAEFAFVVEGQDAGAFLVHKLLLREGLSALFELRLELLCRDASLDLSAVVGQPALLTSTHTEGVRCLHGLVQELQVAELGAGYTRYHAVVVPRMWLLTQRRDCRIFQSMSTPEILEAVFEAAEISGGALDSRLNRSYEPRDYCVQYRESDFSFASRLMEEEGISYFFEHSDSDHVLVLADESIAHEELEEGPSVVFRAPRMGSAGAQAVQRARFTRKVRPGKATLRDYTFKAPTTDLESSETFDEDDELEIYDYPGDYVDGGLGGVLAKLRLEELQVARLKLEGESDARRLCPGFLITLEEHPRDELNQQYLVTEVLHEGTQPLPDAMGGHDAFTYRNRFGAVPSDVPFRPEHRTPRPRIYGVQTALVTGPAGEEIHVDEHGRVKVQFHWDREGKQDENSSCWVRVSHGWAGAGWGMVYLPRIGQEVIVQFLEGDPDRPLITGRVYNGDNTHPYDLPGDKTRSTIKSDSSLGGGGSNELRFEDAAGSEEVYLHSQKDWTIVTENDKNQTTGNNETAHVEVDRTRNVGNNEAITVGVDRTKTVGSNETIAIGVDETLTIGSNETRTIGADLTMAVGANQTETVGANKTQTVAANRTETIGGSATETVAIAQTTTIGVAYTETVGAAKTVTVGAIYALTVGASMAETVAANQAVTVGAAQAVTVGADQAITVGGSQATSIASDQGVNVGGNQSTSIASDQSLNVGGKQSVVVADEVVIKCGSSTVTLKSDGSIVIDGKDLTFKGSGDIKVEASGKVEIKASGDVKVKGSNVHLN